MTEMSGISVPSLRMAEPAPVSALQLGYLGLGVTDLAAWDDFAQAVIGLQLVRPPGGAAAAGQDDGWVRYRLDEQHHRLMLRQAGQDEPLFAGWEVRDEAAMRAMAEKAAAHGLAVTDGSAAEASGRRVLGFIRFTDPDGFGVEVYHGAQAELSPFVSPRGASFLAGSAGLGHIVLRAGDAATTIAFYRDMLGLRLSDFIVRQPAGPTSVVTFMHLNARHHSLAIVGGLSAEQRKLGQRLSHFMLEYAGVDDVGAAFDAVQARSLKSNLLGRHSNDRMISFYAESPSGFNLEFGAGAITVAPETWVVRHYDRPSLWGHGEIKRRTIGAEDHD
jgi:2,3-dihydroxybiphenyl 1,2-dioxygenase